MKNDTWERKANILSIFLYLLIISEQVTPHMKRPLKGEGSCDPFEGWWNFPGPSPNPTRPSSTEMHSYTYPALLTPWESQLFSSLLLLRVYDIPKRCWAMGGEEGGEDNCFNHLKFISSRGKQKWLFSPKLPVKFLTLCIKHRFLSSFVSESWLILRFYFWAFYSGLLVHFYTVSHCLMSIALPYSL